MDEIRQDEYDELSVLRITPYLAIPRTELTFRTSRSSGPGGQNVNKVETRVELLFDVANSPTLTDYLREILLVELRQWLDSNGVLHLISSEYRSQYRNRESALARFYTVMVNALRPRISRRPTRIPRSINEKRLQTKKHRSEIKRQRGGRGEE
ncbi:MAG: alternative ribosome rescue aminoacyl-tRNA hydrolase ArfB [bacterium]